MKASAAPACCAGTASVEAPASARQIVLVGNPNVGKSLFFNAFTGLYVDVSNYPGTTVAVSSGRMGDDVVLDTPGIYGVSSFNDEETVARDIVMEADVIVNVVDAVHLERDLFLTQQILDMGIPMVVALNMVDEAKTQGVGVDAEALSRLLGVPVIPTVAVHRKGFDEVRDALDAARSGRSDPLLQERLTELLARVATRPEALLVLEADPVVSERAGVHIEGQRDAIYQDRRRRVNDVVAEAVRQPNGRPDFHNRLGRALIRPLVGIPVLAATLFVMYEVIGVFVAGTVVGFTEGTVMQGYVEPFLRGLIERVTGTSGVAYSILAGDFGVVTMTVTYVFGLLLPLVVAFYLLMSTLEDSGYLPRIAALSDRLMTGIGLNGRAIIPMILGFGCITMATMTTRILGSERERRIATALMAFAIPCSAQLGVVVALLAAAGGGVIALAYAAIMIVIFGLIGLAMDRVMPGKSTDLLIDLPPLRLPRPKNVLVKTYHKTVMFLREVILYFVAGALLLSVLQITGALQGLQILLTPLTVGWLGLPAAASNAFVMGFVRRDFGATGLYDLGLNGTQILVALVTITLFVPCIASVLIIMKERGKAFTAAVWLGSVGLAFLVGGIVAHVAGVL
ncbi:MAG TPA: ferrous iron transport protein B [Thermoleophilia bacterium]|nr:ferrous iron transport protein B [Thermoleophilia bacterium]